MERISAVICEFNPFHTGHEALLTHARKSSDVLICVMSGNFTQRSECAIYDKYKRAEVAVRMGADIVAELPFPYSSAGAEFFALGGVEVGCALGAQRFIFGSESGDTDYVSRAADVVESGKLSDLLSTANDNSSGVAALYDNAMKKLGFSLGSNDKLAMHYMLAARRMGAAVSFEAFPRMCDEMRYRSASFLREVIFANGTDGAVDFIPKALHGVYPSKSDVLPLRLTELEYIYFRMTDRDKVACCFEGEGGVRERLFASAALAHGHSEFFARAATKRYTDSRLRRAALYELLAVSRECVATPPALTLLLASSSVGRRYLSSIRRKTEIEILTKPSAMPVGERAKAQAYLMRRADELYSLCLCDERPAGDFLRRFPYVGE